MQVIFVKIHKKVTKLLQNGFVGVFDFENMLKKWKILVKGKEKTAPIRSGLKLINRLHKEVKPFDERA